MKIVIRSLNSASPQYQVVAEFDINNISSERYDDFCHSLNSILNIQAAPAVQPHVSNSTTHTITHDLVLNDQQLAALQALMDLYAEQTERLFKSLFLRPASADRTSRSLKSFIVSPVLFNEIDAGQI